MSAAISALRRPDVLADRQRLVLLHQAPWQRPPTGRASRPTSPRSAASRSPPPRITRNLRQDRTLLADAEEVAPRPREPATAPTHLGRVERDLVIFAEHYNTHRPHRALGGKTPATVFDATVKARPAGRPLTSTIQTYRATSAPAASAAELRLDSSPPMICVDRAFARARPPPRAHGSGCSRGRRRSDRRWGMAAALSYPPRPGRYLRRLPGRSMHAWLDGWQRVEQGQPCRRSDGRRVIESQHAGSLVLLCDPPGRGSGSVRRWAAACGRRADFPTVRTRGVVNPSGSGRTGTRPSVRTQPASCAPLTLLATRSALDAQSWTGVNGWPLQPVRLLTVRYSNASTARAELAAKRVALLRCERLELTFPPFDGPAQDFTVTSVTGRGQLPAIAWSTSSAARVSNTPSISVVTPIR